MKMWKLLMLSLLATTLALAGCGRHHGMMESEHRDTALERGMAEMKGLVEQTVKDPEKAKQVQGILQDIAAEVKKSGQQTRGYHEQLYNLNADYEAKPEQFTKILDDLNNSRMQTGTKILVLRYKMKGILTAQEWKDLTEAMDKTRTRYMHRPMGGMQGGGSSPSGY